MSMARAAKALAAMACIAAGVALSHCVEHGVRVEHVTLAGNIPALKFLPAGPGPHPVADLTDDFGEVLSSGHGFFGSR